MTSLRALGHRSVDPIHAGFDIKNVSFHFYLQHWKTWFIWWVGKKIEGFEDHAVDVIVSLDV